MQENNGLVSVIVAVYNIEKYIAKCIDSIQRQTYSNLEIILVDDGSTDTSGAICDSFAEKDNRIIVIHRKNGGLSAARNSGLEIAKGEFIAFVDGDDWIEEGMYETMVLQARKHNAELVACRYACIYGEKREDRSSEAVYVYQGLEMLSKYLEEDENVVIQHAAWNKLYRRELIGDERFPEGKLYEDVVFSAKMLSRINTGVYIDTAYYDYVVNRDGSIMAMGLNKRMFTDLLPAYLEKEELLGSLPDESLVTKHRYHYLKKMLGWYRNTKNSEERETIRAVFEKEKEHLDEICACSLCSKNDERKFRLFFKSPKRFLVIMAINDATLLKIKKWVKHEC